MHGQILGFDCRREPFLSVQKNAQKQQNWCKIIKIGNLYVEPETNVQALLAQLVRAPH